MITGIVVALLLAVIVFQYMIIKIDKDKRHEAGHDKLTGLCNPEHLMQKMKELPDKKKNRLIIYSDIAEFKLINEIFGIEKGNEILLKQADIYDDGDYDWDRYQKDKDYADGVDDAMEEIDEDW